jgi:hypothetical protein
MAAPTIGSRRCGTCFSEYWGERFDGWADRIEWTAARIIHPNTVFDLFDTIQAIGVQL